MKESIMKKNLMLTMCFFAFSVNSFAQGDIIKNDENNNKIEKQYHKKDHANKEEHKLYNKEFVEKMKTKRMACAKSCDVSKEKIMQCRKSMNLEKGENAKGKCLTPEQKLCMKSCMPERKKDKAGEHKMKHERKVPANAEVK